MFSNPEMIELGVGGGLCYLLLKLILEFLTEWRKVSSKCVEQKQFEEYQNENRRLFSTMEEAIRAQTAVFETLLRLGSMK